MTRLHLDPPVPLPGNRLLVPVAKIQTRLDVHSNCFTCLAAKSPLALLLIEDGRILVLPVPNS